MRVGFGEEGSRRRQLAVACAAILSLGCYKYVPTTLDAVPTGTDIRALLSGQAQDELRGRTGMDIRLLEGELLENSGDRLLVSVRVTEGSSRLGTPSLFQRIDVPRSGVERVDMRQLDVLRTAGLIGTVAGATAVVAIQALKGGEPGRPEGPNGGPDDRIAGWLLRVPIFRF